MGKADLQKLMPILKKKFLLAEKYAEAPLREIFPADKLDNAKMLSVDYFASAILFNDGRGDFSIRELPSEAQFSPLKCGIVLDANDDHRADILLFGNFYQNNIQLGRNDADFGTLLINKGNGDFSAETLNGLTIKGQVRQIQKLIVNGKTNYLLAMNNDSLRAITIK
jgi:hypothetical protein